MRRLAELFTGVREGNGRAALDRRHVDSVSSGETVQWLLEAGSDQEYGRRLEKFCSHTLAPLVHRSVSRRMRVTLAEKLRGPERPQESEALEVRSEALRRLLHVLRKAWAQRVAGAEVTASSIRDLEAYVQKTVDAVRADLIRSNGWRRFQHQIRRQIEQHPALVIWKGMDRRDLVGRETWRNGGWPPISLAAPEEFLTAHRADLDVVGSNKTPAGGVILAVLDAARGPIPYDDVVSLLAVYYQVEEPRRVYLTGSEPGLDGVEARGEGARHSIEALVIDKDLGCRLWTAIQQMAPSWRQVLILGNDDLLAVLLANGIASMDDAATAVGLSERGLAVLFASIPLPDAEIARRLGIGVGAVRNQRCQARKALQSIVDERSDRASTC